MKLKLDLKLLKELYLTPNPSSQEYALISYILNYVYNVDNINVELDHYSNLFITKNTTNPEVYPCLIAHMDSVHDWNEDKGLIIKDGEIFAINNKTKQRCGLGADDLNGVYVALHLLKILPDLKIVFTVEEEIGARGATEACFNTMFFKNVGYFLQADRRGNSNLIVNTNCIDCASKEFLDAVDPVCKSFNYAHEVGTFTDVGVLVEDLHISGVNISCGYYNEHTAKERTVLKDLQNCLNFIYNIIKTIDLKIYTHIPTTSFGKYYYHYASLPEDKKDDTITESDYYKMLDNDEDLARHCATCSTFDCMHCKYYI